MRFCPDARRVLSRKASEIKLYGSIKDSRSEGGQNCACNRIAPIETGPRSDDDFDLSEPDHPNFLVQRQFEDDDGGVCYIETQDHDTYAGHFRVRLIEVFPARLAFEIARTKNKYVEMTFDLDAKPFDKVRRISHIIFGIRG